MSLVWIDKEEVAEDLGNRESEEFICKINMHSE